MVLPVWQSRGLGFSPSKVNCLLLWGVGLATSLETNQTLRQGICQRYASDLSAHAAIQSSSLFVSLFVFSELVFPSCLRILGALSSGQSSSWHCLCLGKPAKKQNRERREQTTVWHLSKPGGPDTFPVHLTAPPGLLLCRWSGAQIWLYLCNLHPGIHLDRIIWASISLPDSVYLMYSLYGAAHI